MWKCPHRRIVTFNCQSTQFALALALEAMVGQTEFAITLEFATFFAITLEYSALTEILLMSLQAQFALALPLESTFSWVAQRTHTQVSRLVNRRGYYGFRLWYDALLTLLSPQKTRRDNVKIALPGQ